jgi:hypothetical protein
MATDKGPYCSTTDQLVEPKQVPEPKLSLDQLLILTEPGRQPHHGEREHETVTCWRDRVRALVPPALHSLFPLPDKLKNSTVYQRPQEIEGYPLPRVVKRPGHAGHGHRVLDHAMTVPGF